MYKKIMILGIVGTLLMYGGDMLLYFTSENVGLEDLLVVMKGISSWRIIIGGIIGPLAAFFYAFGFYGIYTKLNKGIGRKIYLMTFLLALFFAGAYHSQFGNLALMSKISEEALMKTWDYSTYLFNIVVSLYLIGTIIYIYMVARGRSGFQKKVLFFNPLVIFILGTFLQEVLVQPYLILISGGWFNITFLIYFISCYFGVKKV